MAKETRRVNQRPIATRPYGTDKSRPGGGPVGAQAQYDHDREMEAIRHRHALELEQNRARNARDLYVLQHGPSDTTIVSGFSAEAKGGRFRLRGGMKSKHTRAPGTWGTGIGDPGGSGGAASIDDPASGAGVRVTDDWWAPRDTWATRDKDGNVVAPEYTGLDLGDMNFPRGNGRFQGGVLDRTFIARMTQQLMGGMSPDDPNYDRAYERARSAAREMHNQGLANFQSWARGQRELRDRRAREQRRVTREARALEASRAQVQQPEVARVPAAIVPAAAQVPASQVPVVPVVQAPADTARAPELLPTPEGASSTPPPAPTGSSAVDEGPLDPHATRAASKGGRARLSYLNDSQLTTRARDAAARARPGAIFEQLDREAYDRGADKMRDRVASELAAGRSITSKGSDFGYHVTARDFSDPAGRQAFNKGKIQDAAAFDARMRQLTAAPDPKSGVKVDPKRYDGYASAYDKVVDTAGNRSIADTRKVKPNQVSYKSLSERGTVLGHRDYTVEENGKTVRHRTYTYSPDDNKLAKRTVRDWGKSGVDASGLKTAQFATLKDAQQREIAAGTAKLEQRKARETAEKKAAWNKEYNDVMAQVDAFQADMAKKYGSPSAQPVPDASEAANLADKPNRVPHDNGQPIGPVLSSTPAATATPDPELQRNAKSQTSGAMRGGRSCRALRRR